MMLEETEINRDTLNSKFITNLLLFLKNLIEKSVVINLVINHMPEVDLVYFKCE